MNPFRRDSVQHTHSPPTTRSHRTYSDTGRAPSLSSLIPFLAPKGHKNSPHAHTANAKDNNSNNADTPRRSLDVRGVGGSGGLVITETAIQPVVDGT